MNLGYDDYIRFEPNSKKENEQNDNMEKKIIIKSRLKREFRSIFVMHGALDLDIPMLSPLQESTSILI